MGSSEKQARRVQAAHRLVAGVQVLLCNDCQDECWVAVIEVHGHAAGEDYKSTLLYRGHLSHSRALRLIGQQLLGSASMIEAWEVQTELLEIQATLW